MPRHSRDRTITEPRFPRGAAVLMTLAAVLVVGLYLIIEGLA